MCSAGRQSKTGWAPLAGSSLPSFEAPPLSLPFPQLPRFPQVHCHLPGTTTTIVSNLSGGCCCAGTPTASHCPPDVAFAAPASLPPTSLTYTPWTHAPPFIPSASHGNCTVNWAPSTRTPWGDGTVSYSPFQCGGRHLPQAAPGHSKWGWCD